MECNLGPHVGLSLEHLAHPAAAFALYDDGVGAIRHPQHFYDARHGAHIVEVAFLRVFDFAIFLRDHTNVAAALVRFLQQLEALVAANIDGQYDAGKQHGVAQWQNGQGLRGVLLLHGGFILRTEQGNGDVVFRLVTQKSWGNGSIRLAWGESGGS